MDHPVEIALGSTEDQGDIDRKWKNMKKQ